jgi:hypothetical protein
MATTFVDYTGDGNATKSFSFPSIKEADIKVDVDGVIKTSGNHYNITSYTTTGGGNVVFTSGNIPASPAAIRIFRDTDVDAAKATFVAGSSVKAGDLNNNMTQILYAAQEEQNQTIIASDLKDSIITSAKIVDGAIATADIAADAITGAKIADDQINSEHYVDGSIDTAHIADSQITTAKIAADAITGAKIADDSINSEHYVDGSIDTAHIADSQVTTAKIADDAVTAAKIANTSVTAGSYTAADITVDAQGRVTAASSGAIATSEITDGAVTTAKLGADSVTGAKIADDAVDSEHLAADSIDAEHYAAGSVDTTALGADAVTGAKIADDSIDSEHYVDGSIDTAHITDANITTAKLASNAVTTAKITDANVTTVKVADSNITLAKLASDLKQTSISNSDTQLPTSGAVVDYVAAQIAPIGGLEVIADEDNFPTSQPASGVVISISDAAGIVVNGSGVSTTARTAGNGSDNVTINNFPSSLYSETLASGVGLMVSSTGSSQTYNYHKILAAENDVKQLSDDINDFNARYRVNAGEPGSNNDEGDLVFDTSANKMKVYDGSSWGEVTSTGDFKFLVPVDAGTTTAATFDGSDTSFDLKETTNSGSAASVTNINQLIVSLNGVVQKPNTGSYSASEEGFYLTDADTIRFCTAPATGSSCFIIQCGSAVSIPTPGDGTVTAAKIASGAVEQAKIADAAVNEAKLQISNSPTNGYFLSAQSGNTGGLTWAEVSTGVTSDGQNNTVAGTSAGDSFTGTDANHNSLYGKNAGTAITTGDYNTALGSEALKATTTANSNTSVGYGSLYTNTTGASNTALGVNALTANTTASDNTAVGYDCLQANTTGAENVAVGGVSLDANTTGAENTAIGYAALSSNTTASYNTAVGKSALVLNTTGQYNTAIGV